MPWKWIREELVIIVKDFYIWQDIVGIGELKKRKELNMEGIGVIRITKEEESAVDLTELS